MSDLIAHKDIIGTSAFAPKPAAAGNGILGAAAH
jgi:hypothetical protein